MEAGEGIAIPAWWFKGWGRRQHNGGCAPPPAGRRASAPTAGKQVALLIESYQVIGAGCRVKAQPGQVAGPRIPGRVAGAGPQMRARRRRKALEMTDTEEKLMAAAAITGLSSSPKAGYSTPAASGTPSEL